MSTTTYTPTLSKHCLFGIVTQGTEVMAARTSGGYTSMGSGTLFPLTAPESIEKQFNREVFRMADNQGYGLSALVRSQGEWYAGDVEIALIPGATAGLISCIQTRGSYNQQDFCSMYLETPHMVRRIWNAKVTRARFQWRRGDICRCTLSIIGADSDQTVDSGTFPADALPYQWKETAVQIGHAGTGVSADLIVEEIDFTLDNYVHDPADGLRITSDAAGRIQCLYNTAGVGCTGTFTRDAADEKLWVDFLSGTTADMTLTISRGGNSMSFTIREMIYTGHSLPIPGDNVTRMSTTVPFEATSPDGSTAPIVLA